MRPELVEMHGTRLSQTVRIMLSLASYVALGCLVDEGAEDGGETMASSVSLTATSTPNTSTPNTSATDSADDETGVCELGSSGCACDDGYCSDPLVCLADICTWPPSGDDGPPVDTGDDASGGMDSGDDSGSPTCVENSDCAESEACGADNVCAYAFDLAYEIRVPGWWPASCVDNGLDADADLWWQLQLDGFAIAESGWLQGGCPGSWPGTTGCIPQGGFYSAFALYAWDEDGAEDDLRDILWWDYDDDGYADVLSLEHLHAGLYDGVTNSGGTVVIEFTVVDGCN